MAALFAGKNPSREFSLVTVAVTYSGRTSAGRSAIDVTQNPVGIPKEGF